VVLRAESKGDPQSLAEARQLEDRLGLNPLALLRLRWEIDSADEVTEARAERSESRVAAVDPALTA
jgi:hypothetical protein